MTIALIAGYLFAVVLGFAGGMFITTKESNRHINELGLGTMIFAIVCVIWLATGNLTTALDGIMHVGSLWLLLAAGIKSGEWMHTRIVTRFMESLRKEDIEEGIAALVRMGRQTYSMRRAADLETFITYRKNVLRCLEDLKRKSISLRQDQIARQVDTVANLVCEYTDLIMQHSTANGSYERLGDDLLEVANYTLSYAEHVLRGSLNARFNISVLR